MASPAFRAHHLASGDGMQTRIWGPPCWFFLHCVSANYPVRPSDEDRRTYARFLRSLGGVLPCRYCRENFPANLRQTLWELLPPRHRHRIDTLPLHRFPVFDSREAMFTFVWRLHTNVSRAIGKPHYHAPDRDAVRQTYENFRSRCLTREERTRVSGEPGCEEPLVGEKGQCVLRVVPHDSAPEEAVQVHERCRVCRRDGRDTRS